MAEWLEFDVEKLRQKFSYDPKTGQIFKKPSMKPVGYINADNGYVRVYVEGKIIVAQRLAWVLHYGEWPVEIDHIDRNRANNKIENLRSGTHTQNNANREDCGEIKRKGVSLTSDRKNYRAQIKLHRVSKHLGVFKTLDEAAHAYNKAAIQYHGEFALLNPIGQDKQ